MTVRIITADVMDGLRQLPDESVNCCVTSPPYFNLRDYQTGTWEGGGASCDHVAGKARCDTERETPGGRGGSFRGGHILFRDLCARCGARRIDKQIGLEATPELYVARLVEVFREVWRVLRKDGTVWLNLGDGYTANGGGGESRMIELGRPSPNARHSAKGNGQLSGRTLSAKTGLKPKDLIGIPWAVAFALRADGWWLRSDIIWHKPNPMPESVTDRCTKSHEYVFLLAKSERYYYDQDEIREKPTGRTDPISSFGKGPYRQDRNGWTLDGLKGANRRSVWTIATEPYADAHFATMPPELAETCIKAGTKKGDTVLDPFCGAGTTLLVADRLQRDAIGIDLSPKYADMARSRLDKDRGGLLDLLEQSPAPKPHQEELPL